MAVAAQNDSICISNSSVSHEAVKAGNYKDAFLPWKVVIETCPTLRYYTFTDGFTILKNLLAANPDRTSADYQKYFDELMKLHDTRIKYIPDFLAKGTKVMSTDAALGVKATDYIQYAPSVDVNQAYEWLGQSLKAEQENSTANVMNFYLDMSGQKLKGNDSHKEQFIQDYMLTTQYADAAIAAATKETTKAGYETVRNNLDAQFINSGVATCESLENIYAPKVEASKDNLEALKDIIKVMDMMGCRDNNAYQQASLYAYQIEPSADAALGCAAMAFKKGDTSGAVKFFDEALKLEDDSNKKAEIAYKAAVVLASKKQLSQARSYAQKAISYKENYGAPYILIATLYAGNYKWNDEPILNKCTFWAAIDKLQRAKSVDPSCTEEANKLIGQYSAYTPESKDLFMLGYKSGDRIAIGGWIGETVTVR
jgi:tetratricopeptide (TPR) repeat protein